MPAERKLTDDPVENKYSPAKLAVSPSERHKIDSLTILNRETLVLSINNGRCEQFFQRPICDICLSCCAAEKQPRMYIGKLYGKWYEVERMFRKLKGFRRVFNHFDRTDAIFMGFIMLGLIVKKIKQC